MNWLISGIAVGLAISIVMAVITVEVDLYLLDKEQIAYQQEIVDDFEIQRLKVEGWIE